MVHCCHSTGMAWGESRKLLHAAEALGDMPCAQRSHLQATTSIPRATCAARFRREWDCSNREIAEASWSTQLRPPRRVNSFLAWPLAEEQSRLQDATVCLQKGHALAPPTALWLAQGGSGSVKAAHGNVPGHFVAVAEDGAFLFSVKAFEAGVHVVPDCPGVLLCWQHDVQ